jgi:tetratricopeptide (TPR) repeat protein
MANNNLSDELLRAEGLLVQGEAELALELLARLAEDAEEYVDRNCPTTDELQWFSFPSVFERLAYRRVEQDPRELRDVGEPLDRLYADLALAHVHCGDYESAAAALRQAVRWNPMGCEHRLNLADLCRIAGDMREHLALSFSVFERASEASHLVRAYLNFAAYFQAAENPRAAAACLHVAQRIDPTDQALQAALEHASGTEADPANVTDDQAEELLAAEGLPEGANAEIAVCLLMCAGDAVALGDRNLATGLTLRARDLVGEKAAMALLELIRSDDEEADDAS